MDESVRLARMEAKLDALLDRLREREEAQAKHNAAFYIVRDQVNEIRANAKGGWFVIGIFAAAASFISSMIFRQ